MPSRKRRTQSDARKKTSKTLRPELPASQRLTRPSDVKLTRAAAFEVRQEAAASHHFALIRWGKPSRLAERLRLGLFLLDFQRVNELFLVVETGDRAGGRFCAILFGVDFVVDIGIEAAEPVIAFLIGDVTTHRIGAHVFQEHYG